MQCRKYSLSTALGLLALLSAGCGNQVEDQPDLGKVTGTITWEGKPLAGASVLFQPESGRPATGRTDAEGKYELTYIRETKGTKIGMNRVEVTTMSEGEDVEAADDETAAKPAKGERVTEVIPAKYNVRSELKADVKPGENTFDFQLTK